MHNQLVVYSSLGSNIVFNDYMPLNMQSIIIMELRSRIEHKSMEKKYNE